jgi:hypothetical protein
MEVSGQLHALVALPKEKSPQLFIIYRPGTPQIQAERGNKENNYTICLILFLVACIRNCPPMKRGQWYVKATRNDIKVLVHFGNVSCCYNIEVKNISKCDEYHTWPYPHTLLSYDDNKNNNTLTLLKVLQSDDALCRHTGRATHILRGASYTLLCVKLANTI